LVGAEAGAIPCAAEAAGAATPVFRLLLEVRVLRQRRRVALFRAARDAVLEVAITDGWIPLPLLAPVDLDAGRIAEHAQEVERGRVGVLTRAGARIGPVPLLELRPPAGPLHHATDPVVEVEEALPREFRLRV